jgi:hypothetical protein
MHSLRYPPLAKLLYILKATTKMPSKLTLLPRNFASPEDRFFHRETIGALAASLIIDPVILLLDMWGLSAISTFSIGLPRIDPTF